MRRNVSKTQTLLHSRSFYDEVFVSGKPRPTYRHFLSRHARQPLHEINRVRNACSKAFHDDVDILGMPMIFSEREYEILSKGTLQRGRAIHSFLYDHHFGGRKYLQYPLMRQLPLTEILKRNQEVSLPGLHQPETLQFWYAPDVIRDPQGQFRVIEDNTGFVGGFGDLEASNLAAHILSGKKSPSCRRSLFYQQLANYYSTKSKNHRNGKIILLSYDQKIRVTHEDQRLAAGLSPFGVEHVTKIDSLRLTGQGLFHRGERVGFVILNRETVDIESNEGTVQLRGFWAATQRGLFGISYVPGIEFVNDKEFYPCVEILIHIYLKETPILKNIRTTSLRKKTDFKDVFNDVGKWVIKAATSRGGEEVWIGSKLKSHEVKTLRKKVLKSRSRYVAQEYVELSRIENHSVDMRPLSMIAGDCQIVSPVPWSRAISSSSNGKVNISGGGLVAATKVIREEN